MLLILLKNFYCFSGFEALFQSRHQRKKEKEYVLKAFIFLVIGYTKAVSTDKIFQSISQKVIHCVKFFYCYDYVIWMEPNDSLINMLYNTFKLYFFVMLCFIYL